MNPAKSRIHQAALRLFAETGSTRITVSELAQAAGIARGTIYNNLDSSEELFQSVAAQLADEMHLRVVASFEGVADPASRLANGVRLFIRRAHEEPHWGRFVSRFAFSNESLQGLWSGPPMRDVLQGMSLGRYDFRTGQLQSVISMIAGSVLSAMFLVLEGHSTWREAGSDTAELLLRGMGVPAQEARDIATSELPPLPEPAEAPPQQGAGRAAA
jgi:AcrR family transcriptional regulator